MSGIIISKTTAALPGTQGLAIIGKLSTPLKMYTMKESDAMTAKKGPADWFCTNEKSDKWAESAVAEIRKSGLSLVDAGDIAPLKGRKEGDLATIAHYQFATKEVITADMVEDSLGHVNGEMRRQMKRLVNDYHYTRHALAAIMLYGGTKSAVTFGGKAMNLPAPNDHPLFYNGHEVGPDGDTQSNIFYNTRAAGTDLSKTYIEDLMNIAAVKMMNQATNDGSKYGFAPNEMIIPGSNPTLIKLCKQAIGSEITDNSSGAAASGINIQYGNWSLTILPQWDVGPSRAPVIFSSKEAREANGGNMFLERIPYTVTDWVDYDTGNYCFKGRCRMSVGNYSYKHAMLFESLADGTTTLFDGQSASGVATSITV